MGKAEEQLQFSNLDSVVGTVAGDLESSQNGNLCSGVRRGIGLRCIFVVVLSLGLALSAAFWLPPFWKGGDRSDLDLDSLYPGHDIVARFKVKKPFSSLEGNISQLEEDILAEIDYSTIKVVVLALENSAGSNITEVVFAVDPETKDTKLSSPTLSVIQDSFVYMVMEPSYLRLTASLFGNPYAFEVLKFPGGITVIPSKGVYLLQKVQIYFNFTLNFSISQIQDNFDDLTTQLRLGLHLSPYENLYIRLTNYQGSTISRPTTVQTSVVMAVGYNPSMPRLKQLAQTITSSHSKNLGLNNTVFGKVKQVSLSSILPHSIHGGDGSSSPSPSPSPVLQPSHKHHYRNSHHHHYNLSPRPAVHEGAPAPSSHQGKSIPKSGAPPPTNHQAKPPGCQGGHKQSPRKAKGSYIPPVATPTVSPHYSFVPPHHRKDPPRDRSHPVPVSSPLPSVVFAHVHPPSEVDHNVKTPDIAPSLSHSGISCVSPPLLPFLILVTVLLHL